MVSTGCQTDPLFEEPTRPKETCTSETELPSGLCYVETVDACMESKYMGVLATRDFAMGEEFGPLAGDLVQDGLGCCNPTTWEVNYIQ